MPFDQTKADQAIDFFKTHCRHTKGKWAGQPFMLLDWQKQALAEAYGTVKANGFRQYRFIYAELPKKNGKSELAAGAALKGLCADDEQGAEVYSAANDRKQASIVFNVAANMVRLDPLLSQRCKVIDSTKRITYQRSMSYYEAVSRDAYSAHGYNPSTIVIDEIHAHTKRDLYDVLTDGTDTARAQQMVWIITTAGEYDKNHIAWITHNYARMVARGIVDDPEFLPLVYSAERKDNIHDDYYSDPQTWIACNPSFGHIFDMDKMQKWHDRAQHDPQKWLNFLRFRLNVWVRSATKWLDVYAWDKCARPDYEPPKGATCFAGVDLSTRQDLTALAMLFVDGDRLYVKCNFYMPEAMIGAHKKTDRTPYDDWQRLGYLTATPGNVVDYEYIENDILKLADDYDLISCAYDPWAATQLATRLFNTHGIEMVSQRLGFKDFSEPSKDFGNRIKSKNIRHDGNPLLRWNVDNVVIDQNTNEDIRPVKEKSNGRIDGVVAAIMALGRANVWLNDYIDPNDEIAVIKWA